MEKRQTCGPRQRSRGDQDFTPGKGRSHHRKVFAGRLSSRIPLLLEKHQEAFAQPAPQKRPRGGQCALSSGDDIYIGGSYEKDWRKTACYWKNGKRVDIRLPEGAVNPTVYSLIVVGNTVHILGSHTTRKESFHYFYLRNGIRVNLPKPAGASYTAFRDLYLVGRDTYITGNWSDSAGNKTACYWKNGKRVDFIQGAEIRYLYSTGKDLYLLVEGPGTFYWKNGTRFPLAEKELSASSLFAVNGDIYLGCSVSLASDGGLFYWKNMKKVPVEVPPGTKYGQIHSLHVVRHE